MIHTIQINYKKIKATLLEYGIEIQEQTTKPKALRIRSINETLDTQIESTLPKDVNFDHDVYTIIGINGQSCRGLGLVQAEQLLNQREDRETDNSTRDVVENKHSLVLLIRGGKVNLTSQTDDCLCGKGCTSEYPADCCTIQ